MTEIVDRTTGSELRSSSRRQSESEVRRENVRGHRRTPKERNREAVGGLHRVRYVLSAAILIAFQIGAPARPQTAKSPEIEAQVNRHLEAAKRAESRQEHLSAAEEYKSILALRPDWALIHQSLGVTLHLAKQYEPAIRHLQDAVRLDEQLWGAFLFLGLDYYQLGQFANAVQALERSEELNPELAETHRWMGLSHRALGRFDEAIGHLEIATGPNRDDAEALFHLARTYDARASQLFERIGQLEPGSPFVFLLQAERFLADDDIERARAEYGRALRARPDLAGTLEALEQGGPAISATPTSEELNGVRTLFAAGRFSDAAERAEGILADRPEEVEAIYWLGRSCKALAATTVQRLAEVAPDSHRVDQLAAEFHRGRTEHRKALEAYERALAKRPELPGLRYAIGATYWEMRHLDDAETWLRKELASNPHHVLARHRLGSLLLARGRAKESLPHLRQAVQAAPETAEAHFDLGRAYLAEGQHEAAVRELKSYARLEPDNDRVHYLLATAYRAMDRLSEAQQELSLYQAARQARLRQVQENVRDVGEDLNRAKR